MTKHAYRKTTQDLMPSTPVETPRGQYNPYPAYPLEQGRISSGFNSLAQEISLHARVTIDGYPGVLWEHFRAELDAALRKLDRQVHWVNVEDALLPPVAIDAKIAPYLGGSDPLFGFRYPGDLRGFFDLEKLAALRPNPGSEINILYGTGAALAEWVGPIFYVDVPKNEIQFRARAGSVKNIGAERAQDPKPTYKRSYFVDWPAANRHKAAVLPRIHAVIDAQRAEEPAWMRGDTLRAALRQLARTWFRPRPWFEPGPWGGQWIKQQVPLLPQDAPNYAWSFELIAPENGVVFESDGNLLEVTLDTLMFQEYEAVLGECAPNFRYEFPIRYDFLDTFDGGNLSVQCHPRPEYIRKHFGETFTQDECYYILDCAPGARVYLGFQEGIDPQAFKEALTHSARTGQPVEIDRYVHSVPVQKHDLLLIPNGTIHGAGIGNLVLEISATPYIFTFKMYDWLRMDLDGKPRSLNVERAFENLYFDRQGERIEQEFVSHPVEIASGEGWRIVHQPTHPNHFYDVHRYEFTGTLEVETGGSCHVLSLVEGQTVWLEVEGAVPARFNYAETFVVPNATGLYRLRSEDGEAVKVVATFVKPACEWAPGVVPGT